jgi:hypothetical protein
VEVGAGEEDRERQRRADQELSQKGGDAEQ